LASRKALIFEAQVKVNKAQQLVDQPSLSEKGYLEKYPTTKAVNWRAELAKQRQADLDRLKKELELVIQNVSGKGAQKFIADTLAGKGPSVMP
jgi:L-lactate utilization protein LutB